MPALPQSLLPSEEDLVYEEELLRNPFTLRLWWRYLQARRDAPARKRYLIYERALAALPGSYKLWHAYLRERRAAVRGLSPTDPRHIALNNAFERALVTMHRMPRIWLNYLAALVDDQKLITRARRTFDRALRSLPVMQHERLWEPYLKFVKQPKVPVETALRVFRRYLKLEPGHVEEYIDFLIIARRWQEAADRLAEVLNQPDFVSNQGKTKHQLWLQLCDILTRHATEIQGLNVDAIIRSGIRRYSNEVGRLWTSLADYYIRKGLFETARDVYEEGVTSVITVRDFSMIFDAYSQFEESMLAAKMEALGDEALLEEEEDDEEQVGGAQAGAQNLVGRVDWLYDDRDVDLRLARLEHLMERRPELVSSVLLRQNPHNVHEWHKRAKLFEGKPERQILTYTEAVKTVDVAKAQGRPSSLWVAFAKLYEAYGDMSNARVVLEKAVQAPAKNVEELATIWCEWAEMELRHHNFAGARELLKRATLQPSGLVLHKAATEGDERPQLKVHKSLKLWTMYVDIEESLGTLDSTRALYEKILDLRIATPQIILNYAFMLEENKYFEDAFKVYERGVNVFKYPHVKDIWTTYLTKFVARYGGKKLERARDLFEQALENVPAEHSKPLFLAYARLEEEHGLARHAMAVYERACKGVPEEERLGLYETYIGKAAELFGIAKTRDIYEKAIESGLPDEDVKKMCLKYAALERRLGEIDRARAIYVHASQLADPRTDTAFWDTWNAFEIAHGNEDTFREMLRIKRSVSASYSQMHFILPEYLMQKAAQPGAAPGAPDGGPGGSGANAVPVDHMAELERQQAAAAAKASGGPARAPMFVSGGTEVEADASAKAAGAGGAAAPNPEEIELGDGEEEDGEEEEGAANVDVAQKAIPAGVFGSLAEKAEEIAKRKRQEEGAEEPEQEQQPMGALERIKRQRQQQEQHH